MVKPKQHKAKTRPNVRGWYILIVAAVVLFLSILPIISNIYLQVTLQVIGYIGIALAVAVEIHDLIKNRNVRLQIDLFMTAFAVVLIIMAGYFVFSEKAAQESKELRTAVQDVIPALRQSLPENSAETGGSLSDVWVSKTENYVFVEYLTSRSLPENVETNDNELKQHVIGLVCNDTQYEEVLSKGWGFTFLYTSTASGKTYQVNVASDDC